MMLGSDIQLATFLRITVKQLNFSCKF